MNIKLTCLSYLSSFVLRAKILTLLLNGAQKLGMTVEGQIRGLHEELKAHNQEEEERKRAAKLGASPTNDGAATNIDAGDMFVCLIDR